MIPNARRSAVLLTLAMCACGPAGNGLAETTEPAPQAEETAPPPVVEPYTDHGYELEGSFLKDFTEEGHDRKWYKADFVYVNQSNRTAWEADNIRFHEDGIDLVMLRQRTGDAPFTGAEYQRRGRYQYGRYEVVMRAAPGSGLVSGFFTHTDGSQGGDPHDEIDIEILGRNPNQVELNYFYDGRMAGAEVITVGYDVTEDFQVYAYEWEPGEIRWYIGDQLVYTADGSRLPLPQTPQRLMMSIKVFSPDQYAWTGPPTFEDGSHLSVQCVSFQAAGDDTEQCSDRFSFDLPPVEIGD